MNMMILVHAFIPRACWFGSFVCVYETAPGVNPALFVWPHLTDMTKRCWWNSPPLAINSLAPGILKYDLRKTIFKLNLVNDGCDISSEIALRWTLRDLSDDKSTLVRVVAWCRQPTSHYLNQCWPRSLPPYGVTRLQWVKWVTCASSMVAMTNPGLVFYEIVACSQYHD